jgi:hypothetical protein
MSILKGIIKGFNSQDFKATVMIIGSPSVWLHDIYISRALESADIVEGVCCAVLSFDPGSPDDCVVISVWG